jgi:Transposase protein
MARGLFSKWKTPVYVGFDTNMTSELLNRIVSLLHEAAYIVVACVSDMGSSNLGLWKQLDVSYTKPYFCHPVTNEKISMFADVPHLLKLIRNWLLQTGASNSKNKKKQKLLFRGKNLKLIKIIRLSLKL